MDLQFFLHAVRIAHEGIRSRPWIHGSDEPVDLPVINGPINLAGLAVSVSLARVGGWNHGVFDRQQYTDRQSAGQIPGAQTASDAHRDRRIAWKERRQLIWKVTDKIRRSPLPDFMYDNVLYHSLPRIAHFDTLICGIWS